MSYLEDKYDQIELYIKGKLSGDELSSFEKELEENSDLLEEVNVQKSTLALFEMDYLNDMSEIIKEETSKKTSGPKKWMVGLGVLLFVSVSAGVGYVVLSKEQPIKRSGEENTQNIRHTTLIDINKTDSLPLENKDISSKEEGKSSSQGTTNSNAEEESDDLIVDVNSINNVLDTNSQKNGVDDSSQVELDLNSSNGTLDNEPIAEPIKPVDKTCDIKPVLKFESKLADHNETNGQLIIVNKTSRSLEYSLNEGSFYTETIFDDLEPGTHHLKVRENDTCIYDMGVHEIKEDPCLKEKEYAFNSSLNSEWSFELPRDGTQSLIILDKTGREVVYVNQTNDDEFIWNGLYDNGRMAEIGIHIVYCKSLKGERCKYHVVVSK